MVSLRIVKNFKECFAGDKIRLVVVLYQMRVRSMSPSSPFKASAELTVGSQGDACHIS